MTDIATDTAAGLNAWLDTHREAEGEATLDIFRFSDAVSHVYRGNLSDFKHYHYKTTGNTALYDGIGTAIDKAGDYLRSLAENQRPENVVMAIMTDGWENVSRKYTQPKVRSMIEHQSSKYAWEISFMGAGLDVAKQGLDLGILRANITSVPTATGGAVAAAFASNARSGVHYRSFGTTNYAGTVNADGSETEERV